jgi:outer membrane protein OmpA-like peptidoglycan-associated protein
MRFGLKIALLAGFTGLSSLAPGTLYQVQIDQSTWQLEASPFACRLTHQVPQFGTAVLERGAGEALSFWLEPHQPGLVSGTAALYAAAPAWRSTRPAERVEALEIGSTARKLQLSEAGAAKVLAALRAGLQPTLRASDPSGIEAQVSVSAANFTPAFAQYSECLAQLLPVNFDQIARTAILYPPAQWELSQASRERLELVKTYVDTDRQVGKIYVDGHSDNQGRRLLNRDLSKKRAEEVSRYLMQLGVSEEMLVTRYHGERYPVVENNSPENRTRNRRVTVRLERIE